MRDQPLRDLLEEIVTNGMAKRVIDILEMIEIEAVHSDVAIPLRMTQRNVEFVAEFDSIGEICQSIVVCHVRKLVLAFSPLGDVFEGRDPPAALHRLFQNVDGASGGCFYSV